MKSKHFFLTSITSSKQHSGVKEKYSREFLLNFAEELGAWMLFGGFLIIVLWIVRILFGG